MNNDHWLLDVPNFKPTTLLAIYINGDLSSVDIGTLPLTSSAPLTPPLFIDWALYFFKLLIYTDEILTKIHTYIISEIVKVK